MNIKERVRRWGKLRFAIVYPFGLFLLFFSYPTHSSFKISIGFIFAGLVIRLWSNGYAIKSDKLTTSGPYTFVRHPLYIGTMLIAIGIVIMLRTSYVGIIFIILMALSYYRTIKKEEKMLQDKFKDEYINYKKEVPAVIPRILPYTKGEKWSFSFKRLIQSKEYKLFFWIIIVVIAFCLKTDLIIEHKPMDIGMWGLIAFALMLGLIDLISEIVKRRNRKIPV